MVSLYKYTGSLFFVLALLACIFGVLAFNSVQYNMVLAFSIIAAIFTLAGYYLIVGHD